MLLDPFASRAPSHRLWLTVSGLVEKGMVCAVMTIAVGVDWGSLLEGLGGGSARRKDTRARVLCVVSLVFFPFDCLTTIYIAISF